MMRVMMRVMQKRNPLERYPKRIPRININRLRSFHQGSWKTIHCQSKEAVEASEASFEFKFHLSGTFRDKVYFIRFLLHSSVCVYLV